MLRSAFLPIPLRIFATFPPRRSLFTTSVTAASAATPQNATPTTLPQVILKGGKTRLFTDAQSPTVYGGAVDRVLGRPAPKSGDIVMVCNGAQEPFAWGLFNPTSMYRVRIMQSLDDVNYSVDELLKPDLPALVAARIKAAASLRAAVNLPDTDRTNVYRLVNSEGDRLSGLVVDVIGGVAVVQSSAAWVEKHRDLVQKLIKEHCAGQIESIVWRQAAELTAEEGWENETTEDLNSQSQNGEGGQDEEPLKEKSQVIAYEAGLKFLTDPRGQKTGFYCDQRDHRAFIRSVSKDKDVLDVCCYSGGFALNAAAGGAASAVGVDSSMPALELAQKNAEMNNFSDRCSFEKADAGWFMKNAAGQGNTWDIVILDPPKLAPSKKSLQSAWRKYEALNAAAMRLVRPGGMLMTCSCSGAVAQSGEFIPMLQRAAKRAKRRVTVLRQGGAAPDHPLDPGYPEGQYLTNITLIVS